MDDRFAFGEQWEQPTICAAIYSSDRETAIETIMVAHDSRPDDLEWRFIEERPVSWQPFSDRFPRADWMSWPAETTSDQS